MTRILDVTTGLVRNLIEDGGEVAFSPDGDLYFSGENRILRMDLVTGQVDVAAGTGEDGYSGDGGPAIEARLGPSFLVFDNSSNLFFEDSGRIRMVDAETKLIDTVAGTGEWGSSGDGGLAIEAAFGRIEGLAVDDFGNLYISDNHNHRVRKVNLESGIITTAVGTGSCHIRGDGGLAIKADVCDPRGLAVDNDGNLYLTDRISRLVRLVRRPAN
jgi:hypothetical protein